MNDPKSELEIETKVYNSEVFKHNWPFVAALIGHIADDCPEVRPSIERAKGQGFTTKPAPLKDLDGTHYADATVRFPN